MSIAGQLEIKRHKREDAEMDITPMIDIVFLLLAFFVVVSTMDPKRNVKLPISEVASNIPEDRCIVIYVDVPDGAEEGIVYVGDKGDVEVVGTEEQKSDQIAEYIRQKLIEKPELEYIMIKAHGDSKNGLVERVKRAAMKGTGEERKLNLLVGVENIKK